MIGDDRQGQAAVAEGVRSDFDERYTRPLAQGDAETAAHLRERIRPFLLRRRKREVAPELPPRTDVVLHCVLSETERIGKRMHPSKVLPRLTAEPSRVIISEDLPRGLADLRAALQ